MINRDEVVKAIKRVLEALFGIRASGNEVEVTLELDGNRYRAVVVGSGFDNKVFVKKFDVFYSENFNLISFIIDGEGSVIKIP